MPRYLYSGESPCSYGGQVINTGDTVEASASPGKRFALVEAVSSPSAPTTGISVEELPTTADLPSSEEVGKPRKPTTKGGGD